MTYIPSPSTSPFDAFYEPVLSKTEDRFVILPIKYEQVSAVDPIYIF
jgi:hypothetical protein